MPARGSEREDAVARSGMAGGARDLPFRAELEAQLGTDLSHIKAFTGGAARAAADELGAHAYASGDNIVFGDDQPSKELVAHELVHTHQTRGGGTISEDEAEADSIGARLAAGERVDRAAITSGGGGSKVRKKTKAGVPESDEKPLWRVFQDFASAEAERGAARRGEDGSLESAEAGGVTGTEDKLLGREAKQKLVENGPVIRRELETKDALAWNGGGFTVSRETTDASGTTEMRTDLEMAIDGARRELVHDMGETLWQAGALDVETKRLRASLSELEGLDEQLVSSHQMATLDKIAANEQRIQKLTQDFAEQNKLLQTLANERRALESRNRTPQEIATALARAETEFKASTKVTQKRSFGFNLLKGTIELAEGTSTSYRDEFGETTTGSSVSHKLAVGGGIDYSRVAKREGQRTDADGNTVFGHETEKTINGKAILGKDGTVGVGGGAKLANSIENSFGKATTAQSFNGAVTVNIIALPKTTNEQLYGVVVTLNLGAACEMGGEKKKLGATVSANFDAQLTQTHVLDNASTLRYLKELEAAGNGNATAAAKKPEFTMLHKALALGTSPDEVLGGAAGVFGSSDAAKAMTAGESTELTLKAGIGGDLGWSSEGMGSISGGGSTDMFRTLKITKLAKDGKELVDVAVAFGNSSEMHGALSASALGVTASAGMKEWQNAESAVTFRLDPSNAKEYAELYDLIVGTTSRSGLIALRNSKQFAAHVLAYSSKTGKGSSTQGGLSGVIGGSIKTEHDRTSSRGKDETGTSLGETGSTKDRMGITFGPLELLSRDEKDEAKFEIKNGISMLDVSETTNTSSVGKFELPSVTEFIAADSPKAALESAVLTTRGQLAGYFLDGPALHQLVERAKDKAGWERVWVPADRVLSLPNRNAWMELRQALVTPKLTDEYTVDQIGLARELAYGTAIAEFFSKTGEAVGLEYMRYAMRGDDKATQIGVGYEFPEGLAKEPYVEIRGKCLGLDLVLANQIPNGEAGLEAGLAHCAELEVDVAKQLKLVEAATGFTSERNRIEMIAELRRFAVTIGESRARFQTAITGVAPTAAEERGDARTRVYHLEETLRSSKAAEQRLIEQGNNLRETTSKAKITDALTPIIRELEQLYQVHKPLVLELRAAYAAANMPSEQHQVSRNTSIEGRRLDMENGRIGMIGLVTTREENVPLKQGNVAEQTEKWRRFFNF